MFLGGAVIRLFRIAIPGPSAPKMEELPHRPDCIVTIQTFYYLRARGFPRGVTGSVAIARWCDFISGGGIEHGSR